MGLAAFSEQLFHHVGSTDAEDWQEREREREREGESRQTTGHSTKSGI